MLSPSQLPAGFTTRPLTLDDARAAAELSNACALELTGRPALEVDEVLSDWQSPAFNLATDTLAVFASDGEIAGYAELWHNEPHVRHFVYAAVHPKRRGQGIGTVLALWAEDRGRQLIPQAPEGARVVLRQFKMSTDEPAAKLLHAHGYEVVRQSLRMFIEFDRPPLEPVLPEGLVIRPFIPGQEEEAFIRTVSEAFLDHWGAIPPPFEEQYREWRHWMETNPAYDPSLLFVAVDGGEIAGTCMCQTRLAEDPEAGWILNLGVRRPWRRRGLALALLYYSFGALYRRGKRRAGLGVDAESLTGATRLYEKAGMHVERLRYMYEKELRAGKDLTTRTAA